MCRYLDIQKSISLPTSTKILFKIFVAYVHRYFFTKTDYGVGCHGVLLANNKLWSTHTILFILQHLLFFVFLQLIHALLLWILVMKHWTHPAILILQMKSLAVILFAMTMVLLSHTHVLTQPVQLFQTQIHHQTLKLSPALLAPGLTLYHVKVRGFETNQLTNWYNSEELVLFFSKTRFFLSSCYEFSVKHCNWVKTILNMFSIKKHFLCLTIVLLHFPFHSDNVSCNQ